MFTSDISVQFISARKTAVGMLLVLIWQRVMMIF